MPPASTSPADLKKKTLEHWDLINKLAQKRFIRATVSEEAALFVLDALEADNWKRLQKFEGKARFSSFLASVCWRLLEDFSRRKFGRHNPPKWIRDAGGVWLSLYRLLCMERFSFQEAVHILQQRKNKSISLIEGAAEQILGNVVGCGEYKNKEVLFDENEISAADIGEDSLSTAESREKELLFSAIAQEILDDKLGARTLAALRKLLKHEIRLSSSERLLLKLCYQEGFSVTKAGQFLGMNRYQVHGKLRRTLAGIRKQFIEAGCADEIRLLLE